MADEMWEGPEMVGVGARWLETPLVDGQTEARTSCRELSFDRGEEPAKPCLPHALTVDLVCSCTTHERGFK